MSLIENKPDKLQSHSEMLMAEAFTRKKGWETRTASTQQAVDNAISKLLPAYVVNYVGIISK